MNPYLILAGGIAWIMSVVGAAAYWGDVQKDAAKAECTTYKNKQLSEANDTIIKLTKDVREREAQHAAQMETIGTWLAKETKDAEARTQRAVRDARALVMRNQPTCPDSGAGATSETPATPGGGDGQAGCELPATTVRALLGLVFDADRDVRQLAACQQVILSDRKENQ